MAGLAGTLGTRAADAHAARLQFTALNRLVGQHDQNAHRLYYPAIQKQDAAYSETQQLLSRAFGGNFGLLMSNFIDNAKLSKNDLEELYDMLKQAEEGL